MATHTQNRAHDDVSAAEARLLNIIEHQPMCLVRVAVDGTLLAVNEAALVMLGADSLQKVLNTSLAGFVADGAGLRRFVGQIADGTRGSLEVEFTSLTGNRSTVLMSGSPAPSSGGLNSALLAFRDLSEQRRLEQSLLDAAGAGPSIANRESDLVSGEAAARIAELEQALRTSESRRMELEALLGQRDGTSIDLDAGGAPSKGDSWRR